MKWFTTAHAAIDAIAKSTSETRTCDVLTLDELQSDFGDSYGFNMGRLLYEHHTSNALALQQFEK